MIKLWFTVFALVTRECALQEQEGPYRGKFIGAINTYHHQVSGEVYAVDDWTLLLVNFNYDGTGDDTFFWAGDSVRPGPQGFIVPDQHGKTNILERYINAEVRVSLPDGKRVSRLKWFCVYDIDSQNAFGDVYVPDEFESPAPRSLPAFTPAAGVAVSSKPLQFLTATTLLIPEFKYDGSGEEVYFWTGVGPQPSAKGVKIPDEDGYLEPLRVYRGEDVRLTLAGGLTAFDISWLCVWDAGPRRALAAVLVPDALNVPPARAPALSYESRMPHCKQLHRDYQVSWEVFGPQVTFELAAQISADEYLAWGLSGRRDRSEMQGADVAVAHYSEAARQATVQDYNISAKAPCVQVLDRRVGVCRDDELGGVNSYQLFMSRREEGLTVITFRRSLAPDEPMDLEWSPEVPQHAVWAVGRLDDEGEPAFHRLYHKRDLLVDLKQPAPLNDCFKFTGEPRAAPAAWETAQLFDPALRVFRFTLGPAGGRRGPAGRGRGDAGAPLAWYVNGQLAPDLQLRRGLRYSFEVLGGNDPHSAHSYHPLVLTATRGGAGLARLDAAAQARARVLAGAHSTRRGRLTPTAAGSLCLAAPAPGQDRRREAAFASFRAYNRSLRWSCDLSAPAALLVAPNSSWPDLVYYNSFTHQGMGGRIFIVDRHKRNLGRRGAESGAASLAPLAPLLLPGAALALAASLARRL